MKYIMFEHFSGSDLPVIFPSRIGFLEMRQQMPYPRVVSAGYVQLRDDAVVCHGKARELDTEARPEDSGIITEKLSNPDD